MRNYLIEEDLQKADKRIVMLKLSNLTEYLDVNFQKCSGRPQPFRAYSSEDLKELSESIKEQGVINPIVVRTTTEGNYQILAGRNRTRAADMAGLEVVPAIVKENISDDEAALIMLDTNLRQRRELLYSEKAYAYKMRMDIMKCNRCTSQDTLTTIGTESKESRRTVAYLIRLTYLIPELLSLVDKKKLLFRVGVELSYLTTNKQRFLYGEIKKSNMQITLSQSRKMKELSGKGGLTNEVITDILKPNSNAVPNGSFTISSNKLSDYSELLSDKTKIENLFLEFLKQYKESMVKTA